MTDPSDLTSIADESARIEEDALHSGKGHLSAAERWAKVHFWMGICATALSTASALSLVSECKVLTAIGTSAAGLLTALMTFMKSDERATQHRTVGNRYLSLRNRARIFRLVGMRTSNEPSNELALLSDTRNTLNEEAPQIPRWAYERAKKGIDAGEAKHLVDDHTLPGK